MSARSLLTLLATFLLASSLPAATPTMRAIMNTQKQDPEEQEATNPEEIRRGIRMGGEEGKSREQVYYERLIRRVEPTLQPSLDRLPAYIHLYMSELIHDDRLFATQVSATHDPEAGLIRLDGHVMFEENRNTLELLFRYLDLAPVENNVRVLPDANLRHRFAVVSDSSVYSYDAPAEPRETMTESFFGDPIYVLAEADNNHVYTLTTAGYVGYIDRDALEFLSPEEFTEWCTAPAAIFRRDVPVKQARHLPSKGDDSHHQAIATTIPAGARLPLASESSGLTVRLVSGELLQVDVQDVFLDTNGPAPQALEAVEVSRQLLGTDYVWGGKTARGVDCSGLVQRAYAAQGIHIARDAYMQSYSGKLSATRWHRHTMMPGDLMYFLSGRSGRITHTAIYIGNDEFIEASGEVKITSLDPQAPNYEERRAQGFAFAKRLFE